MSTYYSQAVLSLFLVLLLLSGCEPSPQASPLNSPIQLSPTPTQKTFNALPKPTEGKAVLTGVMKVKHTNTPMIGVELYLANHIGSTLDTPMYGMDPSSAPRTITDNEGRFVFDNLPPGRYAIVVWNPFNSFLVRNPETDLTLTVDIQSGQIYDIGTLYESLPQ